MDDDCQAGAHGEVCILFELVLQVDAADDEEAGFDVVGAQQTPGGYGDAANDGYFGGSGGLVLGFDGIEQNFEIVDVFVRED